LFDVAKILVNPATIVKDPAKILIFLAKIIKDPCAGCCGGS